MATLQNCSHPEAVNGEVLPIETTPGYHSWPMLQHSGSLLCCVYSSGREHRIEEVCRNTFLKCSSDLGRSWGPALPFSKSSDYGDVPVAKGCDAEGNALFFIRRYPSRKNLGRHHDLYKVDKQGTVSLLAQLILSPEPMQITDIFSVPGVGLMALYFATSYNDSGNSWGVLTSSDNGHSWLQRTVEADLPLYELPTEASAVYCGDGRILAVARTENKGAGRCQFQLESDDSGLTWRRSKTNIQDVSQSTPSLLFDPRTGMITNYYFERGKGLLKRRCAALDSIWNAPANWQAPEILCRASQHEHHAGNVNAVLMADHHYIAFYSGTPADTSVFVLKTKKQEKQ